MDTPDSRPRARSRYGFAATHLLLLVVAWQVLRLVLYLAFGPAPAPAFSELAQGFLTGLHRDILVALALTMPLLVWFWLLPERWFGATWHRCALGLGLLVFWAGQIFLLFAEYYFFEEFRSRFNTVAVDYLLYPHEVFINIWDSYPVGWVLGGCGSVALVLVGWLFHRHRTMWANPNRARTRLLSLAAALTLAAVLSRPISLREVQLSRERILNEIANNGTVSFLTAFWTGNLDFAEFYKTVPISDAYQRVRRLLTEPTATFIDDRPDSIHRRMAGDPSRPKLNVVILLEESLGSEFWGSLGRTEETLTPKMDQLAAEEGMLFTNLYASGNRTVRGFEGVLSSFPPLPGDAIVRRDLSGNVETIARVLKRDGYSTVFLYGGRGMFDGMRSFALNNGYDRFIEQKHFVRPTHTTIWGVCDEDLFTRSIEEFRALSQAGQPFCATVLSVSNHKPYTYPKGRIAEDPDERRRRNAVKYSDYALGKFFEAARREPFWTNTIFAVVADHGARVYGSQKIPIHSYEIPLLIAGPAVVNQPTRVPHLGCSLDVAPTLLGLIGRPYESLFFGRDLLRDDPAQGRVLVNHNRDIGFFAKDKLIVFGLRKTMQLYQGDPKRDLLQPATATADDEEFVQDAIALFQVADDLYMHRRYRLDPDRSQESKSRSTNAVARGQPHRSRAGPNSSWRRRARSESQPARCRRVADSR